MELVVKLLSPVCVGSGAGRAGVVDREAIFDPATGLPQVPGRRLKGLLRDAYSQILRAGGLADRQLPSPEKVFGATGGKEGGWIRIGDANLDAALYTAMERVVASEKTPIRQVDVLAHFSEVRRQTAVDRESGVADDDTLRFTRVLRAGLEFRAAVHGLVHDEARHAVALAAAGVKRMGTARSRGWGEVEVRLEEAGKNLLDDALKLLRTGASIPSAAVPSAVGAMQAGASAGVPVKLTLPTHRLRYQLTLRAGAVLPVTQQADPNTASSSECITGSTVRGLLAHRYLAAHGVDARFHHLFTSGNVAVLPANPLANGEATVAIPHSVRTNKRNSADPPWDLALDEPLPNTYQPKRAIGWATLSSLREGLQRPPVRVATNLHYHHQRAHDSRVQRALGSESGDIDRYSGIRPGQQGALFVYESLLRGQSFGGEILGAPTDLQFVQGLLASGSMVQIGRSKSAQYGGQAEWHWTGDIEEFKPIAAAEGKCWFVWLLTPMIALNEYGHPAAEFPVWEIHPDAKLKKAFTRRDLQSGYLSHQNLPRQQMPGLAAGSMLVLDVPAGLDPESIARRSYGLRPEEGFGRIAIAQLSLTHGQFEARAGRVALPALETESAARNLALEILKEQIREQTKAKARRVAEDVRNVAAVRGHQLHRMVLLAESGTTLDDLAQLIQAARKTAARQFERVRVPTGPGRYATLSEYLIGFAKRPAVALDFVLSQSSTASWDTLLGQSAKEALKGESQFELEVCRAFVISFLSALARRRKNDTHD